MLRFQYFSFTTVVISILSLCGCSQTVETKTKIASPIIVDVASFVDAKENTSKDIDGPLLTYELQTGKKVTVCIPVHVKVTVDGKEAGLNELKKGMKIKVYIQEMTVTKIEAER